MKQTETRKYEMLTRVLKFGEAHRDLLNATSDGGEALAAVAEAVEKLTGHGDATNQAVNKEKEVKTSARAALVARLRAISRTARVAGRKTPGFQTQFRVKGPSKQSDQAILSLGRTFVKEVAAEKDRFRSLGMSETFVADLEKLVETFAASIADHEDGRDDQAAAQAGISAALKKGLDAVAILDVIVGNQLIDHPEVMAVWERDRNVEIPRRIRKRASGTSVPASVQASAPVSTPAPTAPAASAADTPAATAAKAPASIDPPSVPEVAVLPKAS